MLENHSRLNDMRHENTTDVYIINSLFFIILFIYLGR